MGGKVGVFSFKPKLGRKKAPKKGWNMVLVDIFFTFSKTKKLVSYGYDQGIQRVCR
jgi:hypothetical protein